MTNQINGYFVFAVTECDWIVAEDANEAKAFYREQIGDEAALREIQQLVKDYQKSGLVLVDIRKKCREALTTGEGE